MPSVRTYDRILNVASSAGFVSGNSLIGVTSKTVAVIANVNSTLNQLKVKIDNTLQEFSVGETITDNVFIMTNLAGTSNGEINTSEVIVSTKTITSITQANPGVGTAASHGFDNGDTIQITDVVGMTQVNGNRYKVANKTTDTFELLNTNTTDFSAYTSAGKVTQIDKIPFFVANTISSDSILASTTISAIANSPFIAEKNAFVQDPVVRLYSIYYPGEWYPPNPNGNPSEQGAGRAWPTDVPYRFAEIVGDTQSDTVYRVQYDKRRYIPYPVNFTTVETGSDGKINEVTISISNFDNIISTFVENPFLTGNNIANSVVALVNDEFVHGIDPRTVNANPSDLGSSGDEAFDSLTAARAKGLNYSADVVGRYGTANASWTYSESIATGGDNPTDTWQEQKQDTRDLLGGVVEVKTTFAKFLDFWPEYSSARYVSSNVVEVLSALAYRVGDNVIAEHGTTEGTIRRIEENRFLVLSNSLDANTSVGDNIYIVNPQADSEAYIEDVFKIDNLESLDQNVARFGLISWLQYFRLAVPKRKYYKNTCQWVYKGPECQYPGVGGGVIPGTFNPQLSAPNQGYNAGNEEVTAALDVCGKSIKACQLRNNQIHFGGFPATGRTIPRQ